MIKEVSGMELNEYLEKIIDDNKRNTFEDLLKWTKETFTDLELHMKWNQPMFLYNETFIIYYTNAKNHISIAPEKLVLDEYVDQITDLGYEHTKMLFKIKFIETINHDLLKRVINRSIEIKKDLSRFWL